ncbi:helix-turn-helix transcriptional regulator [Streptomyces sp. NPDC046909]|uniref:helix-turn-helix domain-containing protein n=1 Tax=Streptomyces sp. NPDC046909 TaxID=3155617 RepID=UPI0033FB4B52
MYTAWCAQVEVGSLGEQVPIAWRYCGNQFKMWRQEAGISREQVGAESNYSPDTITSFERGVRRLPTRLLALGDEMFGARGKLKAAAQYLEPEKYPPRAREFMDCEARAIALQSYQGMLVPGLLQSEDFARAMLSAHYPPLDEETIEVRTAARVERRQLLFRKPPSYFAFVVDEIALRREVGGPEVMRGQCELLLELGALRNVDIQVLPISRGAHVGLGGPFVVLETADHEQYAFEEGQTFSALYSDPETVGRLSRRISMIRMQALSTEESAEFIKREADSW